MSDKNQDMLPQGLSDILPPFARAKSQLCAQLLDQMTRHGYQEVSPPLIEFERSLAWRMQGPDRNAMIRFVDPLSLRTMALRSDITVQIGRIATTLLANQPRPLRLCYAGQALRLAPDAKASGREMQQLGAELIGYDHVHAASETLQLAISVLKSAGIDEILVDFTLPDLVDTLAAGPFPLDMAQAKQVRRELDAKDAGALMAIGKAAEPYLELLYAMGEFDGAIERLAEIDAGGALASRIKGLREIAAALPQGLRISLDPSERHGFEYQSWFGFTLYSPSISEALARGGSYAIQSADGAQQPACGFSLYPDLLIGADQQQFEPEAQILLLPIGTSLEAASNHHQNGWQTRIAMQPDRPLADQARHLGCSHILQGERAVAITDE